MWKRKLAFDKFHGLFWYKRARSGPKTAPTTFQRAMDAIISTVKWQGALVYLGDVVVFIQTPSQHIEQVANVLGLMKSAELILKLEKYFIFTRAIEYLEHTVRSGALELARKTSDAIRGFRPPTNIREPRLFLDLCIVHGRFGPSFFSTASPLNSKL